jgi:superoxide dismutase, Cu-Zn family
VPRFRLIAVAAGGLAVALSALAWTGRSEAWDYEAQAVLVDPTGEEVGRATFTGWEDHTDVRVRLYQVPESVAVDAFHGFHVHANSNPANGEGCVADPGQPSNTWFVSADGHYAAEGQTHGDHLGDLPSLLVNTDGTADARFRTGRFTPADVQGRALILHAGEDNFGNVPVGSAPNQYAANAADAATLTANTGNAGDRLACGLIDVDG